jgi:hypothetical protein
VIVIAGSGPSVEGYDGPVTVCTKKRSLPAEYLFCRFGFQAKGDLPLMLYYRRNSDGKDAYYCNALKWDKYYKQFIRSKRPPQRVKPSLGTCAVMGVVERWNPKEIGVIGFDNILDGNDKWEHDAIAERRCIESLVKIVDLRQDS